MKNGEFRMKNVEFCLFTFNFYLNFLCLLVCIRGFDLS
jgi:hypothetical protein